jgi:single-strand DNA-binding protein
MNNYNGIGRLTADPESHTTANSSVTKIRIAVNGRKKSGDAWEDDPTFINCEAWGNQSEFISSHFEKGKEIWVQGELKVDQWEKDGVKQSAPKIKIRQCGFTSGKAPSGEGGGNDFV